MASRTVLALLLVAVIAVGSKAESDNAGELKIDNYPRRSLRQLQPGFPGVNPVQPGFPQPVQEQPIPLDFRTHRDGCPRDYVITMTVYGLACTRDTRTNTNPRYPARDEMSVKLCPRNFLYRLIDNYQPACLPESLVFDGIWTPQRTAGD